MVEATQCAAGRHRVSVKSRTCGACEKERLHHELVERIRAAHPMLSREDVALCIDEITGSNRGLSSLLLQLSDFRGEGVCTGRLDSIDSSGYYVTWVPPTSPCPSATAAVEPPNPCARSAASRCAPRVMPTGTGVRVLDAVSWPRWLGWTMSAGHCVEAATPSSSKSIAASTAPVVALPRCLDGSSASSCAIPARPSCAETPHAPVCVATAGITPTS